MNDKMEIEWLDDCIAAEYLAIEQINKSIDKLVKKKGEVVAMMIKDKLEKVGV